MALYHFHHEPLRRSQGRRAVNFAAYVRAQRLFDEELQKFENGKSRQKHEVLYSEILVPFNAPKWAKDIEALQAEHPEQAAERLWNLVEKTERRKDSRLARVFDFALQLELTQEQNIELARSFIADQLVARGMIADWSIHWDPKNPHVHVMATTRELKDEGFGKCIRAWNSETQNRIWREEWANYVNAHFAKYGHNIKIDHRSYKDRGIDLIPTKHLGKDVLDMHHRGIQTELMQEHHEICKENLSRIIQNPEIILNETARRLETFTSKDVVQSVGRYINDQGKFSSIPEGILACEILKKGQDAYQNYLDYIRALYQHSDAKRLTIDQVADILEIVSKDNPSSKIEAIQNEIISFFQSVEQPSFEEEIEHNKYSSNENQKSNANNTFNVGEKVKLNFLTEGLDWVTFKEKVKKLVEFSLTEDQIKTILQEIEYHESAFGEKPIGKVLMKYTENEDDFRAALNQIKSCDALIHLGTGDDGRERYTTRRMFDLENSIQTIADELRDKTHRKFTKHQIESVISNYQLCTKKTLTIEQREAVEYLIKSNSIACLVGKAGTGKSFSLGAAKDVWKSKGLRVLGIALSAIAADGLKKDAGIESNTIKSFCYSVKEGHLEITNQDVILMDEAGMTDSEAMESVLSIVSKAGAKLVLVGDPEQLQPVGNGASFRALLERTEYRELLEVYRQVEKWQKNATKEFAKGNIKAGLKSYHEKDCIHFEKNKETAFARLVADWKNTKDQEFVKRYQLGTPDISSLLSELLVIAYQNEDVNRLNKMIRQQRVSDGELAEGYSVGTKDGIIQIAQGERLLFLQNDKKLGVSNGRFATVTHVKFTESGKVLYFKVLLDGKNEETLINSQSYKHFTYGYAATVHKTQGKTVDHCFIFPNGFDRYLAYVALTRHRKTAQLYLDETDYADIDRLAKKLTKLRLKDSVLDFPLAFAKRRDIDTRNKEEEYSCHLSERLYGLAEKLKEDYERTVNPERYYLKKREEIERTIKYEEREYTRQRAKLVAEYVDSNILVGKSYSELDKKILELNLGKFSFEEAAFAKISATEEYRIYQSAMLDRDEKAYLIMENPLLYERAIELHQLEIDTLKNQAEKHKCHRRVKAYYLENDQARWVLRDRIAHDIYFNIKSHYSAIKLENTDTKLLKAHAIAHKKRLLLKSLDKGQKEDFRVVEQYYTFTQKIAQGWLDLLGKEEGSLASRHRLKLIEELSERRDQIAYQISQNPDRYEVGLNFFSIGLSGSDDSGGITQEQKKVRQTRWYKLKQVAERFEIKQRVEEYYDAWCSGHFRKRVELAGQIIKDTKAHHGAIVALGEDTKTIWRTIREDAKRFDRLTHFYTLDLMEQSGFIEVEKYVEAKEAHGRAWKEILEYKESNRLSNEVINRFFAQHATPFTSLRDKLADNIAKNPILFTAGLSYFKISMNELDKQAYSHQCSENLNTFVSEADFDTKGQTALLIMKDPKAHHRFLASHGLSWKTVSKIAKQYERKQLFLSLPELDKKLVRLIDTYKKANRNAGKLASRLILDPKTKTSSGNNEKDNGTSTAKKSSSFSGTLISHGEAPYEHAKDNKAIYFVTIKIGQDEKTLWGVDLKRVMNQSDLKLGDEIQLIHLGKQPVTVKVAYKFKQGRILGEKTIRTHRNTWAVQKVEKFEIEKNELCEKEVEKRKDRILNAADSNKLDKAFAKRDYLSFRLVNELVEHHSSDWKVFIEDFKLDADKLLKQQTLHRERICVIEDYQRSWQDVLSQIEMLNKENLRMETLEKASFSIEMNQQLQKRHFTKLAKGTYEYALLGTQLNKEVFKAHTEGVSALKEHVSNLISVAGIDSYHINQKVKTKVSQTIAHESSYKKYDENRLQEDLAQRAEEVARHYLGQPKSRTGNALQYGSNKGSLHVNFGGRWKGRWRDFQTGEQGNMISLIAREAKLSYKDTLKEAARFLGGESLYVSKENSVSIKVKKHIGNKVDYRILHARKIYKETVPIKGTLAERYLREHRGILDEINTDALRFHPKLETWHSRPKEEKLLGPKYVLPALVAAIRDENNEISGVQAIFLDPKTAKKATLEKDDVNKLSKGSVSKGTLVHKGQPGGIVAFGEGLETSLSVAQAHPEWTVYTTWSSSNFMTSALSTKASSVVICSDNDGKGSGTEEAVKRAIEGLSQRGVDVWVALPEKAEQIKQWDFNDALIKKGIESVKKDLDARVLMKAGLKEDVIKNELSKTLNDLVSLGKNQSTSSAEFDRVELSTDAIVKIQSMPLEEVLGHYVDMELEQTKLFQEKLSSLGQGTDKEQVVSTKLHAYNRLIKAFSRAAKDNASLKKELDGLKGTFLPPQLSARGGFVGIKDRISKGQFVKEDVQALVVQIRNQARASVQSLTQDQHRGGGRSR